MIPRTFNAKDTNGNGLIDKNEEPGYFTNMVERLDELKTYGINTLHWLPINPPGQLVCKGQCRLCICTDGLSFHRSEA